MMPSHAAPFTPDAVLSDALLVQRIAALSDKTALAELDGRHGMTLYAIAYSLLLDREAADEVVATAFREVWRSAASFDARGCTVRRWLADLTRRAAHEHLQAHPSAALALRPVGRGRGRAAERRASSPRASARPRRWAGALFRFARVAGMLAIPAMLLA